MHLYHQNEELQENTRVHDHYDAFILLAYFIFLGQCTFWRNYMINKSLTINEDNIVHLVNLTWIWKLYIYLYHKRLSPNIKRWSNLVKIKMDLKLCQKL